MKLKGYEYGYDSGSGSFAKQSGSSNNEVDGHFAYPSVEGQQVDIKYTAGVNGYVPYTVGGASSQHTNNAVVAKSQTYSSANSGPISPAYSYSYHTVHDSKPALKTNYNNNNLAVTKSSGFSYNVQSEHPTATWAAKQTIEPAWSVRSQQQQQDEQQSGDASYRFDYRTGDASRQEASDASGNIHGQYSYTNEAGQHDLHYVAGAATGFQVTGGSLAIPNGIDGGAAVRQLQGSTTGTEAGWKHTSTPSSSAWQTKTFDTPVVVYNVEPVASNQWNDNSESKGDASYNFAYNVGDSARQEVAEQDGSVQGKYSFTNEAGQHDLHYKAGAGIGFVVTGGSLAVPNGIDGGATVRQLSGTVSSSAGWSAEPHQQTVTNDAWTVEALPQHRSQSNNGHYQLSYQVGSGLEHNNGNSQFSVTKLLPAGGNSKYGYAFDSY